MTNINDTLKRINELAAKKKSGQELTPDFFLAASSFIRFNV